MNLRTKGYDWRKRCHAVVTISYLPPDIRPELMTGKVKVHLDNSKKLDLQPVIISANKFEDIHAKILGHLNQITKVSKTLWKSEVE